MTSEKSPTIVSLSFQIISFLHKKHKRK